VLVRDASARLAIERRRGLAPDTTLLAVSDVTDDPAELREAGVIFVAVKTYATLEALRPLRAVLPAATPIVSLQNGLLQVAQIGEALGATRIVLAPTTEGGVSAGPGAVRRVGRGMTTLGWARERGSGDLQALRDLLIASGLHARVVDPIEPYVWAKLIANAAINPLTAIARVSNGTIAVDGTLRARAERIAREAAALAAAEGVTLPFADPVAHVLAVARATAENRSSMLTDLERGRPTEIEAINGVLSALGRRHGIATPEIDRVADEVRAAARA